MADDRAPTTDHDEDSPILSRSLDDELRDPFGRVDDPATPRRRPTGPPPPAQSLLEAFGRSTGALLTPDPPAPSPGFVPTAPVAPTPVAADGPDASGAAAAWSTGPMAPPPPTGRQPSLAPGLRPLVEQPPLPAAGAPALPSQVAFTMPSAPAPAGPSGPAPAPTWLPPPPAPPTWVPPGARVPPGGGAPAWAPAGAPVPPPPSGSGRPVGLILAAAAVAAVLVAVAVGVVLLGRSADPAERPVAAEEPAAPDHPDVWDARIDPIAAWVADERNLAFEHPVEVVLQPEEEYLEQAAGDPTAIDEDDAAELDDMVAAMRSVGLIEGDVDLSQAFSDLGSEGTLAYYDPSSETVFVRGDELTPDVRVTLAHELTHVLQDQHFDLSRVSDPDFERSDELRAMAEGDARRIEDAYVDEVLTADERAEYDETAQADGEEGEESLADVPPVLSIIFASPYTLGEGFLHYTADVDGADPYDALLEDPPSEQELLDPSIRGTARADEVEVDLPEVPDDAEVIDDTPFGPLGWYLLLASRGNAGAALEVVDGWGGDASVSYREDDTVCTAMAVAGDTPAATDKLYFALMSWAAAGPDGSAEVTPAGDTIEVRSCDPGAEASSGGSVSVELLAVPLLRAQLEAMFITESQLSADEARCVGGALVTELTVDELQGPATPETTALIEDTALECAR